MPRFNSRLGWLRVAVVAGIAAATTAACGGSGSSSTGADAAGGINRSFVIGSIEPMTGSNALSEFINGVKMAVDDINAHGGIGGKKVVLKQYDDGLDAAKSVAAARLAIADKVDAVIGMPSTIENNAALPLLQRANVLVLSAGIATPVASDEKFGNPLTFRIPTPMPELIYAQGQYVIDTLKPATIGMMGLNTDYGQSAIPQFQKAFDAAGIDVTASKLYPYDATDLTSELSAMKGSDAVLDWSYPNQMAVGLKTVAQYGLADVPYVGGPSSAIVNSRGAVPAALQEHLYGVQPCDPQTDSRSYVRDWAARYEKTFGEPADYSSPTVYDAVNLLKAAIEEADSLDHKAIAQAIEHIDLTTNTMCATEYKVDDRHQLMHAAVVMGFKGGVPSQAHTYAAADLVGHGTIQK